MACGGLAKTFCGVGLTSLLALATGWTTTAQAAGEGLQCWSAISQPQGTANRCCPQAFLDQTFPRTPITLSQVICELLVFPTDSRAEVDLFRQLVVSESVVRDNTPAATVMIQPSLWWNRDSIPARLGGHRLVESWLAYQRQQSSASIIDVIISPQFWGGLTLPERYGVLNQFGHTAQQLGYHLRLLDNNGYAARLVGIYACIGDTCLATVDGDQLSRLQQQAIAHSAQPATPLAPLGR